jgi:hypothetical protein
MGFETWREYWTVGSANDGHLLAGVTAPLASASVNYGSPGVDLDGAGKVIAVQASDVAADFGRIGATASTWAIVNFRVGPTHPAVQGTITWNGTSILFATPSDYRAKTVDGPFIGATEALRRVPVHSGAFHTSPTKNQALVMAHELQAVVPEAVAGEKDQVDHDGQPMLQGVDFSKVVPYLIAAIGELDQRLESTEAALKSKEGRVGTADR